jgi:VirK protein
MSKLSQLHAIYECKEIYMMRYFQYGIGIFTTVFATCSFSAQPQNLPAIERMLARGASLTAVVDLGQCVAGDGAAPHAPKFGGGFHVNAYLILPDDALQFSDQHLTADHTGQAIWQMLRYKVDGAGKVAFSMRTFKLPSYEQQGPVISYSCVLGKGLHLFTHG